MYLGAKRRYINTLLFPFLFFLLTQPSWQPRTYLNLIANALFVVILHSLSKLNTDMI